MEKEIVLGINFNLLYPVMPHTIQASLLSASNSVDLHVTVDCDPYSFSVLCHDLLSAFEVGINMNTKKVEAGITLQNSKSLRAKVDRFIEKYSFLSISVHRLRTYLQGLPDGEHIIFHWGPPPTTEQGMPLFSILYSLKNGGTPERFEEIHNMLFTEFLSKYKVISFYNTSHKRIIGEHNKAKRVCRFCNNKRGKVTFKNRAHAISESLGNKNIILNEECDECNSEFGSGIERDLIAYLKPYAFIFGVKGKKGVAAYKGKNFVLSRNDDEGINLNYFLAPDEKKGEFPVHLRTFDSITMQNIYRVLCKYALSVIDKEYLEKFKETLEWVKREKDINKLPLIAILKSYKLVTLQPKIILSICNEYDKDLPFAIGEFRCTYLTFVFIIPRSLDDINYFNTESNYKRFWSFCKHYNAAKEWDFIDFSENKKKDHVVQLNMKSSNNYSIQHL